MIEPESNRVNRPSDRWIGRPIGELNDSNIYILQHQNDAVLITLNLSPLSPHDFPSSSSCRRRSPLPMNQSLPAPPPPTLPRKAPVFLPCRAPPIPVDDESPYNEHVFTPPLPSKTPTVFPPTPFPTPTRRASPTPATNEPPFRHGEHQKSFPIPLLHCVVAPRSGFLEFLFTFLFIFIIIYFILYLLFFLSCLFKNKFWNF